MAYHVKRISCQSQGMREEAANELEQEEGRVDGDHNLDPCALGPRHFGCRQRDRRRNIARLVFDDNVDVDTRKPVGRPKAKRRARRSILISEE